MKIEHDKSAGILAIRVSLDERLALNAANLPMDSDCAIRGRLMLEAIQEQKNAIQSAGMPVSDVRVILE